jgi:hypothetical protein
MYDDEIEYWVPKSPLVRTHKSHVVDGFECWRDLKAHMHRPRRVLENRQYMYILSVFFWESSSVQQSVRRKVERAGPLYIPILCHPNLPT